MIPKLPLRETVPPIYASFLDALSAAGFGGEIRADLAARLVAATDNSIYQILPAAVIFPRSEADIVTALSLSQQPQFHEVRFSARGAGTGTNGQSLTGGIIIDCSRHMTAIREINTEQGWVEVEPGVVRDVLNAKLAPLGYFFAPDLSPSNRATIGGMINTDACGKGSRTYGRTSNHVLQLSLVLSDGSTCRTRALDASALADHKTRPGREGELYRLVDTIVTENEQLIDDVFPKMKRFLTGYNLAHVYDAQGHFHLDQLVCGSEGSLAVVSGARLKLTPLPATSVLVAVKYAGFNEALSDAMALLDSEPTAIETVDEKILELAREDAIWHRVKDFLRDEGQQAVGTVNLVEFSGADAEAVAHKLEALKKAIAEGRSSGFGYYATQDPVEKKALWDLRSKGVGLLGNMKGNRKAIAFVEDTAVPPAVLAEYIAEFRALLDGHGLQYAMYGHVDVGCLHVRPALDPRLEEDERLIREISDAVLALVRKYGGIMWAEHGKGFRSEYTPLFFGDQLYTELRRIKEGFDPHNQLNPGKVVSPLCCEEPVVSLESPLKGQFDRQVQTELQESFEPVFGCNGNGACFNADVDHIMCPSSKVTRDRIHSPKGRATLLREWLRRLSKEELRQGDGEDFSHQVKEAMNGCLSCKACATQCPIHVDIPEYKARFLAQYHERYGRPKRDYLVGFLEQSLPLQATFPALTNGLMNLIPEKLMTRATGMVDAPRLAPRHVGMEMKRRGLRFARVEELDRSDRRLVLLLPDAFTYYYDPTSFWATYDLLERIGFKPRVLPYRANGKPMHIKGFLARFKKLAEANDAFYAPYASLGIPVIGVEPSIVLTWRDEYPKILGRTPVLRVALMQEWLAEQTESLQAARAQFASETWYLMGHCMERTAQLDSARMWRTVFEALGQQLTEISVGCCGMAGTYGHEVEHREESRGIFEMSWQRRMAELPPERILITGYSCRTQSKRFGKMTGQHPAGALLATCK